MFRGVFHQEKADFEKFKKCRINTSCDILAKPDILRRKKNVIF